MVTSKILAHCLCSRNETSTCSVGINRVKTIWRVNVVFSNRLGSPELAICPPPPIPRDDEVELNCPDPSPPFFPFFSDPSCCKGRLPPPPLLPSLTFDDVAPPVAAFAVATPLARAPLFDLPASPFPFLSLGDEEEEDDDEVDVCATVVLDDVELEADCEAVALPAATLLLSCDACFPPFVRLSFFEGVVVVESVRVELLMLLLDDGDEEEGGGGGAPNPLLPAIGDLATFIDFVLPLEAAFTFEVADDEEFTRPPPPPPSSFPFPLADVTCSALETMIGEELGPPPLTTPSVFETAAAAAAEDEDDDDTVDVVVSLVVVTPFAFVLVVDLGRTRIIGEV